MQKDKKLFSYDIIDKQSKPYVKVNVNGEDKVRAVCAYRHVSCRSSSTVAPASVTCKVQRAHLPWF